MVFATVVSHQLPSIFTRGESTEVLRIAKNSIRTMLSGKFTVADDINSMNLGGEYYLSLWGNDMTGKIDEANLSINDDEEDNLIISYFPNPAKEVSLP